MAGEHMGWRRHPRLVLLAAPRGTCAGVDRAVKAVEQALRRHGAPVYVRKHIVHNRFTVQRLAGMGAVFVDEINEVPRGAVVVISAHGAAPAVHAEARDRALITVDATCPLVSKIHHEADRLIADGHQIVYIGQNGHDEVLGVTGIAPPSFQIVGNADDVARLEIRDPARVAWLSQTTLSMDAVTTLVGHIRDLFPLVQGPPRDDICYAAQNRQNAVRAIAARADIVLVVGSAHSHNSRELVSVARAAGAGAAHLIDGVHHIQPRWLRGVRTVGLSAGASAPELLVQEVLEWLGRRGYTTVEEITTNHEGMRFAPPRGSRT
jgi:4-hydroxy-3-methylbut-2-enyl diphosphate reductase